MAGLVAAARARELGARPVVHEKGSRPGGSMLLSSCVVWRHREWEDFRAECSTGDERLQRTLFERLDEGIAWLESLGATVLVHGTGNERTVGKRFDPRSLTETLVRAAGDVRLESESSDATILATGGFARRFAEERGLLLRANPWSDGAGLDLARARGAGLSAGIDEFYGRAMPAPPALIDEAGFVPLAQLYGRWSRVLDEAGAEIVHDPSDWSETRLVQAIAGRPGCRAWYLVDDRTLRRPVRERTVAQAIEAARAAGGAVIPPEDLPFEAPAGYRLAVHVQAAVTHTIGGLRIDDRARVLDTEGAPIDGLFAAGAEAGGISTGGYASGLAAALVFGRVAAETVCGPR